MPSITVGNTVIKYEVVRSDRKTMGINIGPETGVVESEWKEINFLKH